MRRTLKAFSNFMQSVWHSMHFDFYVLVYSTDSFHFPYIIVIGTPTMMCMELVHLQGFESLDNAIIFVYKTVPWDRKAAVNHDQQPGL